MDKSCIDCSKPVKMGGQRCQPCSTRHTGAARRRPSRPCKLCGEPIEGPNRTVAVYCSKACKFADPQMRAKMAAPQNRVTKTCPACEQEFSVPVSNGSRYEYCSKACSSTRGRDGVCKRCGADFRHASKQNRSYCSESCRRPPVLISCGVCEVEFRVTPSDENKRRYCSMRCYRASGRETGIERAVRLQLEAHGLRFLQEAQIGAWVVDFLVEGHLVIEADGSYWHSKRPAVDQRKTLDLEERDYEVWRLTESEIHSPGFPAKFAQDWERYWSDHWATIMPRHRSRPSQSI